MRWLVLVCLFSVNAMALGMDPPADVLQKNSRVETSSNKTVEIELSMSPDKQQFFIKNELLFGSETQVYDRWQNFREINLRKSGPFTDEAHGDVTEQDQALMQNLSVDAQDLVNDHHQFRIKHFALNWNKLEFKSGDQNDESLEIRIPYFVRLMFYRPSNQGGFKSWGVEIDQGSQYLIGDIVLVKSDNHLTIIFDGYDETSPLEEIGQTLHQSSAGEIAIQNDISRIQVAISVLNQQLNGDDDLKTKMYENYLETKERLQNGDQELSNIEALETELNSVCGYACTPVKTIKGFPVQYWYL